MRIFLLFFVSLLAKNCENTTLRWDNVDNGGKYWRIAANMKSDVLWALSRKNMFNHGYRLHYYQNNTWYTDKTQPESAGLYWNVLAVDPNGNPAYITTDDQIVRKEGGVWTFLVGCSTGIAIGPDGILYRRDCDFYVNKYQDGEWKKVSERKCSRMAVAEDGRVWIRDYNND